MTSFSAITSLVLLGRGCFVKTLETKQSTTASRGRTESRLASAPSPSAKLSPSTNCAKVQNVEDGSHSMVFSINEQLSVMVNSRTVLSRLFVIAEKNVDKI